MIVDFNSSDSSKGLRSKGLDGTESERERDGRGGGGGG